MKKYTLKELKNLVRSGKPVTLQGAIDITDVSESEIMDLWKRCEKVGYSSGIYGINGGLIQDRETGKLYVIIARNSNLFRIF